MPGLEIRQQRQAAAGQQADPEKEALAQAGPDSTSSSLVHGIALYTAGDESVYLSFQPVGDETDEDRSRFLPNIQIESSI